MADKIAFIQNKRNRDRIKETEKEVEELEKELLGEGEGEEEKEDKPEEKESKEPEPKTAEEKTWKKRHGDLRRHMAEKEREWEEKFTTLETALKENKALEMPATDESVDEWKTKFPEAASIVETIAMKRAKELFDEAKLDMSELKKGQGKLERDKAEAKIRKAHPDFDDLQSDDEFHDWVEEQPKWVQDALFENSDDPQSVVRVIDLYKSDKGLTVKTKKKEEKEAVKGVKTKGKPAVEEESVKILYKESQVAEMDSIEYEKHAEAIDKAMAEGKFEYDISGAVR